MSVTDRSRGSIDVVASVILCAVDSHQERDLVLNMLKQLSTAEVRQEWQNSEAAGNVSCGFQ